MAVSVESLLSSSLGPSESAASYLPALSGLKLPLRPLACCSASLGHLWLVWEGKEGSSPLSCFPL